MYRLVSGLALLIVIIGLPSLVYFFALNTNFGQVVLIFSWADDEGMHLGDVVALGIAAPIWMFAVIRLIRLLRHTTSLA